MKLRSRGLAWLLLASLLGGLFDATPAAAKILKTKRPGEYKELTLTVGSGFEYETDGEESEYGFPFLAEYGLTKIVKVAVEPSYVMLRKKNGTTVSGPGDLETTLTCEFPTERRYRPGIALAGVVKWPTAKQGDFGTGETDYSIGAILSKDLVWIDLDLDATYTFIGSPPGVQLQNTFEVSMAGEYHLNPVLDLEGEFVTASGAGGRFHGTGLGSFANIGGPEQGQTESEVTLGLAEYFSKRFKLEEGIIYKSGGSYQAVIGWEFDFGEGK